jgi:hypothetical protein
VILPEVELSVKPTYEPPRSSMSVLVGLLVDYNLGILGTKVIGADLFDFGWRWTLKNGLQIF